MSASRGTCARRGRAASRWRRKNCHIAVAARGPDPYEEARGREVSAALAVALSEIDDEAREVLLLRDAEDLSYEEIAEILEVPVGTVRSRLHRARNEVRRRLSVVLHGAP